MKKLVQKYATAAGLQKVSAHSLRHTFAAYKAERGELLIVLPNQDSKQRKTVARVAQLLKEARHRVRIVHSCGGQGASGDGASREQRSASRGGGGARARTETALPSGSADQLKYPPLRRCSSQHRPRGRAEEALAQPFPVQETAVRIGGSVGLAVWPDDGSDAEALLRQADWSMYLGKRRPDPEGPLESARSRGSRQSGG